jgi:hypothetical protein
MTALFSWFQGACQPTGMSDCHEDARSALECGIRRLTDSYRLVHVERKAAASPPHSKALRASPRTVGAGAEQSSAIRGNEDGCPLIGRASPCARPGMYHVRNDQRGRVKPHCFQSFSQTHIP